ncbi:sulfite exporter TauE/SafE family protein [Novosphingobium album (ex Liu et al. 2023)]|uniref:Probable membrane transporter protein n=1 Tax=Novosphingobium album (ex Liu et al. 2023) TaxID=3031130 RepID=A0ABT5WT65_9SPHN|nr:sulfite exporter TauE/SafE family protein [Novosphingobium album (ex Liu et al. 2023)]MDE8652288.1 sulfite exporter TauE/SafE family protein [Novosphingobium album (ex Liu et al. 2023)]
MEFPYVLSGAAVGFLVGLTGVGGGSLMAPLLIILFNFTPAKAIGTDLWFAAITKMVGGTLHGQIGSPDWQVVRRLALGSVPAAVITLLWLGFYYGGRLEADLLMRLLGVALLVVACITPMKERLSIPLRRFRAQAGPQFRSHQLILTVVSGALIGCLVTITSVGAGALVAVFLMLVYPLRMNAKTLVGTDILHAIPLALVAAIGHSWLGNVDWTLLGNLLIGSIPGVILGSLATGKVEDHWIRNCLAVMLAISGLKMLLG